MPYNFEKYRAKREKVLGVRKRGFSFGLAAGVVASIILIGLAGIAAPQVIDYLTTRNLDDAIYKLADGGSWSPQVVNEITVLPGVKRAVADQHAARLVVTFNRNDTDLGLLEALLKRQGLKAELLNRSDHRQRQSILAKETKR
ncbi:MAG: hypothetical protein HGA96_04845 [Desulfobulbaceae bacterium]|nr:hypothetical protein [Desulfobulbaceae bacterium]